MTDKARELLERTAEILELLFEGPNDVDPNTLAMLGDTRLEEIRDFLSTPEPTQDDEPVAWTNQDELNDLGPYINCYMYLVPEAGDIPLYLHPAPRPEFVRLSEEEVSEILSSAHTPYEAVCATENRLAEKNND